jgi:hypothetical protein
MKTVIEKVSGIIIVSENTTFNHISASEVIVKKNIVARLFGNTGKLTVEKDAIVYLHGECTGEIINNEGVIYRFLPTGLVDCLEAKPAKAE